MLNIIHKTKNKDNTGHLLYKCSCPICGNIVYVRKYQAKTNNSCGCQKGNYSNNIFVECGDIVQIIDKNENCCIIDTEDLDKVSKHYWYKDSRGYWVSHISRHNHLYLHKFVLDVTSKTIQVDHIYHKLWDNRKSQLRPCNYSENQRNRRLKNKNELGYVNIYKTSCNRYRVILSVKGKPIRLGHFDTLEEAIIIREKARKEYYKEFGGCQYVN